MYKTHPIIEAAAARTRVDQQRYLDMYQSSMQDNAGFWSEQARRINWVKPFSKVKDVSFEQQDLHIRWFEGGTLNAAATPRRIRPTSRSSRTSCCATASAGS